MRFSEWCQALDMEFHASGHEFSDEHIPLRAFCMFEVMDPDGELDLHMVRTDMPMWNRIGWLEFAKAYMQTQLQIAMSEAMEADDD